MRIISGPDCQRTPTLTPKTHNHSFYLTMMKLQSIFFLAAGLLLLTSCSDDVRFERDQRKILTPLIGTWQIEEIIITLQDGTDSIPAGPFGTLTFADCELEVADNRICEMTQTLADGRSFVTNYQIQASGGEGSESLTFFEPEGGSGPGAPVTELLVGSTDIDVESLTKDDELRLVNRSLTALYNIAQSVQIRARR